MSRQVRRTRSDRQGRHAGRAEMPQDSPEGAERPRAGGRAWSARTGLLGPRRLPLNYFVSSAFFSTYAILL